MGIKIEVRQKEKPKGEYKKIMKNKLGDPVLCWDADEEGEVKVFHYVGISPRLQEAKEKVENLEEYNEPLSSFETQIVTVSEDTGATKPYPKWMIDKYGSLFYFYEKGVGLPFGVTLINYEKENLIDLNMDEFRDFNGTIFSSNN